MPSLLTLKSGTWLTAAAVLLSYPVLASPPALSRPGVWCAESTRGCAAFQVINARVLKSQEPKDIESLLQGLQRFSYDNYLRETERKDVPFQIADAPFAKGGQRLAYFGRMSLPNLADKTKNGPLEPMIFKEFIDFGKGVNVEKKYKIQVSYYTLLRPSPCQRSSVAHPSPCKELNRTGQKGVQSELRGASLSHPHVPVRHGSWSCLQVSASGLILIVLRPVMGERPNFPLIQCIFVMAPLD